MAFILKIMFSKVDLQNVKNWANERFFNNDPTLPLSTPNAEYDKFVKWIDELLSEQKSDGETQLRDSDLAGIFYQQFERLVEAGLIK
jgi:hypothetical protein